MSWALARNSRVSPGVPVDHPSLCRRLNCWSKKSERRPTQKYSVNSAQEMALSAILRARRSTSLYIQCPTAGMISSAPRGAFCIYLSVKVQWRLHSARSRVKSNHPTRRRARLFLAWFVFLVIALVSFLKIQKTRLNHLTIKNSLHSQIYISPQEFLNQIQFCAYLEPTHNYVLHHCPEIFQMLK